jgi:hypothetical protein
VLANTHPIDVLPTLASLCGTHWPHAHEPKLDGLDLSAALLRGEEPAALTSRTVFMQWHRGDVPERFRNASAQRGPLKWYRPAVHGEDELYDLQADPAETVNLAGQHPEGLAELRAAYEAWFAETLSTHGPGTVDPPRIVVGSKTEMSAMLTTQDWRIIGQEGWDRDDLRGVWLLEFARGGAYTVRVCFKENVAPGQVNLRINGQTWRSPVSTTGQNVTFTRLDLPAGFATLEAWRTLDDPSPSAYLERFVPPLFVQLTYRGSAATDPVLPTAQVARRTDFTDPV